jgi:AcrR family transcriptional regulator
MSTQTEGQTGGLPVEGLPPGQLARRERIVDAGLRVLERQEYDQIQIRDVAEAAGVARATLYRYFSSKDHLYACVLTKWSALDRDTPRYISRYNSEERVRSWIRQVIGGIERQPQFFKALIALQDSADPNAKALMTQLYEEALIRLAQLFEELGPARAKDTAMLLYAIVNTLAMQSIYHDGAMSEVYRLTDRFIDSFAADLR